MFELIDGKGKHIDEFKMDCNSLLLLYVIIFGFKKILVITRSLNLGQMAPTLSVLVEFSSLFLKSFHWAPLTGGINLSG